MTAHVTDIQTETGFKGSLRGELRYRWRCSCGRTGPWRQRPTAANAARRARTGGVRHVALAERGVRSLVPNIPHDLDAANQYQAFLKGWTCSARMGVPDPLAINHTNTKISAAYKHGYDCGAAARGVALSGAAKAYGYEPSILRGGR